MAFAVVGKLGFDLLAACRLLGLSLGAFGVARSEVALIFGVGPVNHHLALAHFHALHLLQHAHGVGFGHFKERAVGGEVDAPDVYLRTLDVAVHEVDDFTGVEVVALAEVDKKPFVARLSLTRPALRPAPFGTLAAAFAARLLLAGFVVALAAL